jgi:UDP-N-acetylglucosamine acyltransferase
MLHKDDGTLTVMTSTAPLIHPTAIIDPTAQLAPTAEVGAYATIGPRCVLANGVKIGPHATLVQNTKVGQGTQVHAHAALGGDPQDLSYNGEETWLTVGAHSQIREFVTLHRSAKAGQSTMVGDHVLLMTTSHVGHDCVLGNHVIIASSSVIAGHVTIGEHAFISGLSAVHQHCRVGAYAIVGGMTGLRQDVPPFCKASGNFALLYGLNSVGLRRHGITAASRAALKRAYKCLWHSGLTQANALQLIQDSEDGLDPHVQHLLHFVQTSTRGIASVHLNKTATSTENATQQVNADMDDPSTQAALSPFGVPQNTPTETPTR